jgi:hypothetical protein
MCNRDRLLLKSRGRIQWNKVCVAMLPSSLALFQVNFAKLWSPPYYPFGYFVKRPLPFANSTLPNCKVYITTSASQVPNSTMSFGYFAKLPSPLHPVNCPNEYQAAQQFLGCLTDFSFPACQNLCSQKSDWPWPSPPPRPFLPTLSLFSF